MKPFTTTTLILIAAFAVMTNAGAIEELLLPTHIATQLGAPGGAYTGSSSAFGTVLNGEFDVNGNSMDIHLSSTGGLALTVDCSGVAFSVSGSSVNGITDDSCISAALSSNGVSVKSFTYSGDSFTITLAKSIIQF